MTEPFIAEIRIFPYNFAPRGWAFCNGQLLPIAQNTALFSLVGTIYGGDGRTTFALPDLQSRLPLHPGHGPGLSNYQIGRRGGAETSTLSPSHVPSHAHSMRCNSGAPNSQSPIGNFLATEIGPAVMYSAEAPDSSMAGDAVSSSGSASPHNNVQPFLALGFCIALQGVYPSRS